MTSDEEALPLERLQIASLKIFVFNQATLPLANAILLQIFQVNFENSRNRRSECSKYENVNEIRLSLYFPRSSPIENGAGTSVEIVDEVSMMNLARITPDYTGLDKQSLVTQSRDVSIMRYCVRARRIQWTHAIKIVPPVIDPDARETR
jgi:hypothetical protein